MKKYLLPLLALFWWSCGPKQVQPHVDWTDKTISLQSTLMHSDSAFYRTLWANSLLLGDILIGCDFQADKMLSVFQIRNDSMHFQHRFLAKGRGPNEMLLPIVTVIPEQNRLMIYESMGADKLFTIDVDTTSGQFQNLILSDLPEALMPYLTLCPIDSSRWIGVGSENSLFSTICNQDGQINDLCPYPEDRSVVSDPSLKIHAYIGTLLKCPARNRFAYLAENNRYLVIFEYQDGKYSEIATPYKLYPQYSMASDDLNISRNGDAYAGNLSLRVTRENIYVLMNDMTYQDLREQSRKEKSDWTYSSEIFVFDWDGNPAHKYVLDTPVQNIMVDINDKCLYGVSERIREDDTAVLRFQLP